jgi:dUTPase
MLANSVGVVDPFYCGNKDEVLIEVFNFRDQAVEIKRGESLAQGMIIPADKMTWKEVEIMPDEGHGGYSTSEK